MKEISEDILKKEQNYLLFIHTPFCGTCHIAKSFLTNIETALKGDYFYDMNGSFYAEFLQNNKIRSVPCLLIRVNGNIEKKIYTFHSTAHILNEIIDFELESFKI